MCVGGFVEVADCILHIIVVIQLRKNNFFFRNDFILGNHVQQSKRAFRIDADLTHDNRSRFCVDHADSAQIGGRDVRQAPVNDKRMRYVQLCIREAQTEHTAVIVGIQIVSFTGKQLCGGGNGG